MSLKMIRLPGEGIRIVDTADGTDLAVITVERVGKRQVELLITAPLSIGIMPVDTQAARDPEDTWLEAGGQIPWPRGGGSWT